MGIIKLTALVCTLTVSLALASCGNSEGKDTASSRAASEGSAAKIVRSGECGDKGDNLKYTIDENSLLTIYGSGDMADGNKVYPPFKDNRSITGIVISEGVTNIGNWAFYNCTSAKSITIPNSVTSIGDYALWDCPCLTEITIPDSVVSIGDWAFNNCTGLTRITIGSKVASIGEYAFRWCTNLTSITIPNSVTSIGTNAFINCPNLTIKCSSGSYAEKYAKDNDLRFETIE